MLPNLLATVQPNFSCLRRFNIVEDVADIWLLLLPSIAVIIIITIGIQIATLRL